MEIIYGTGNPAKIAYMKRVLSSLPLQITAAEQAAGCRGILLPEVWEDGDTPLANARIKAQAYAEVFDAPVFSCDSGLYLWREADGSLLPDEEQPGIHVRGRGAVRQSDAELLERCRALVQKYGYLRARYQNAICLIWKQGGRREYMEKEVWGREFRLTDVPHAKRVEGFPLDCLSVDIETGRYFYDLGDNLQDELVSVVGFDQFFCHFLELHNAKR